MIFDKERENFIEFVDRVRLIVLTPHGRAGSLFVHGLLNEHPQILSFPFYIVSYPRGRYRGGVKECVDSFLKDNNIIFSASDILSIEREVFPALDRVSLARKMCDLLGESVRDIGGRELLCALFCANAVLNGEAFVNYHYMAVHLHSYDGERRFRRYVAGIEQHRAVFRDFVTARYLALTLNPALSLASYVKENNSFGFLLAHAVYVDSCFKSLQKIKRLECVSVCELDIDDLNDSKGFKLNEMISQLGLSVTESLSVSTFGGFSWGGVSSQAAGLSSFSPGLRMKKNSYIKNLNSSSKEYQYLAFFFRIFDWAPLLDGECKMRISWSKFLQYVVMDWGRSIASYFSSFSWFRRGVYSFFHGTAGLVYVIWRKF